MAAGISVHPALQIVGMMGEGTPESMAEAVTCPQLILPAGNDPEVRRKQTNPDNKHDSMGCCCGHALAFVCRDDCFG